MKNYPTLSTPLFSLPYILVSSWQNPSQSGCKPCLRCLSSVLWAGTANPVLPANIKQKDHNHFRKMLGNHVQPNYSFQTRYKKKLANLDRCKLTNPNFNTLFEVVIIIIIIMPRPFLRENHHHFCCRWLHAKEASIIIAIISLSCLT